MARRKERMSGKKCKLFEELIEGVAAMRQQREEKITLQSHQVEGFPGDLEAAPNSLPMPKRRH